MNEIMDLVEQQRVHIAELNIRLLEAERKLREAEYKMADAHIIEMHPEFHGRCIKEINLLKHNLATAENLIKGQQAELADYAKTVERLREGK